MAATTKTYAAMVLYFLLNSGFIPSHPFLHRISRQTAFAADFTEYYSISVGILQEQTAYFLIIYVNIIRQNTLFGR